MTTKAGRIRLLEERITRLEEEVRTLTAAMRGMAPIVPITPWPITPWKSPFVYTPLTGIRESAGVTAQPMPTINIGGPVQTAGTFKEDPL